MTRLKLEHAFTAYFLGKFSAIVRKFKNADETFLSNSEKITTSRDHKLRKRI